MLDHKHLIVNAYLKNPPTEKDIPMFEEWLRGLVSLINMKIVDGPFVRYVSVEGNEGITAAVLIETSHISCHIWDKVEKPYIRFDVYSCADFDVKVVIQTLKETFQAYNCKYMVLDRNGKNMEISSAGGFK